MDGRLFEQQRNENSNERFEVRIVQCEKRSSSRISIGPSDVLGHHIKERYKRSLRDYKE